MLDHHHCASFQLWSMKGEHHLHIQIAQRTEQNNYCNRWLKSISCSDTFHSFLSVLCHIKLLHGTSDLSLWNVINSSPIVECLYFVNISCSQSQPSSSGALKPYLDAVRATLLVATCLRNFPSQNVERHNKPEVEVR